MRKATFTINQPTTYHEVPIPDYVRNEGVIDYLLDHLNEFSKYINEYDYLYVEPLQSVVLETDDGEEIIITPED